MGGLKCFQIFLENTVYYSEQTVSGNVLVELSSPKSFRAILVKFKGEANVEWSESESTTDSNGQSSTESRSYSAREKYFNLQYYLMGNQVGNEVTLPQGRHVFPFQVVLPPNLPSSFEGSHGHVRYTVKAVMDRPWKFNHEAKAIFTILQPLDLNKGIVVEEPYRQSAEKSLCCLCCASGPIMLDVSIPITGYVPGQAISFEAQIDNASTAMLEVFSSLHQKVQFHATTKTRTEYYQVCEMSVGSVVPHGSGAWAKGLLVPAIPPSFLQGCKIIDISYTFQVMARIPGAHTNLITKIPVVIGTIPLMGSIVGRRSPQPQASDVEPSAPLESPTQSPEMSPPSYEECMQGKRDVREKDEGKYVGGDTMFAPCYPVYQFNK